MYACVVAVRISQVVTPHADEHVVTSSMRNHVSEMIFTLTAVAWAESLLINGVPQETTGWVILQVHC